MKTFLRTRRSALIRYTRVVCLAVLGLSAAVSAQETPPETPQPADSAVPDQRLSTNFPGVVDPNLYKIGTEDVISVRVWREPELTMQQTVRPDGKITMPLIGDVNANDVTPKELTAVITAKLKEFINNPNVMVTVEQVRSKKYTITGEVNRPGSYPLLTATTVLDALTNSGGFRDFANKKKISIIRGGERLRFNYNEVIEGKNMEQNIILANGDLIVVP